MSSRVFIRKMDSGDSVESSVLVGGKVACGWERTYEPFIEFGRFALFAKTYSWLLCIFASV